MKPYVNLCSNLRAHATNDFERDFFKIMENSVYGKTVEIQSKRSDIRTVQSRAQCKKLTEKPQCLNFRIFSEHLAAVQSKKASCMINKPFYVGFSVLDISKVWMYRFHYDFIKPSFLNHAKLLFTDTDSLMYEIEGGYKKVYEAFNSNNSRSIERLFDFSSLPPEHPCYNVQNKKVIGKFKDETAGDPILEFIGLRPKMYSFTTLSDMATGTVKEKHRAKGIQYAAAKLLTHAQYLDQLNNPTENRLTNRRIGSQLHVVYTLATEKRALCAFDDKRYLCEDGVTTLAFGHNCLPPFVKVVVDAAHPMDPDAAALLEQERQEKAAEQVKETMDLEDFRAPHQAELAAAIMIEEVETEMESEAAVAEWIFEDPAYEVPAAALPPERAPAPLAASLSGSDREAAEENAELLAGDRETDIANSELITLLNLPLPTSLHELDLDLLLTL